MRPLGCGGLHVEDGILGMKPTDWSDTGRIAVDRHMCHHNGPPPRGSVHGNLTCLPFLGDGSSFVAFV